MPHVKTSAGFTLTELVLVIVIAGILAAVAYTKVDISTFDAPGFTDQVRASVRYANKLAVAQRRSVYVLLSSGDTLALCYDSGCSTAVTNLAGNNDCDNTSAYKICGKRGTTIASAGTPFSFDSKGQPSAGPITITVTSGTTSQTITVESTTGFVH